MGIRRHAHTAALAAAYLSATTAAGANEDPSPALSWNCGGCHGPAGISAGPTLPSIAGMDPRYFMALMRRFASDERWSTVMGRIARGYDTLELRSMALYFADQTWAPAKVPAEPAQIELGAAIHEEHCVECHDDDGRFQDKEIPRLAGQWPAYLLMQLLDYRSERVPMPQPDKMRERLADLSDADLTALSAFYGQIDAAPPAARGTAAAPAHSQ
jgi:sulfide dehydrogenase cytochrome subunit